MRAEAHSVGAAQFVRVRTEGVTQMEACQARALRVVLVRDRRSEERHDAVAGVLVDRALEAVHAFSEDLEEALENPVPLFGIELLGQFHRALPVGEEHRDLFCARLRGRTSIAGCCRRGVSGCTRAGRVEAVGCRLWDQSRGRTSRAKRHTPNRTSQRPATPHCSGGSAWLTLRRTPNRTWPGPGCRARRTRRPPSTTDRRNAWVTPRQLQGSWPGR